jgi:ribosomal protein L22
MRDGSSSSGNSADRNPHTVHLGKVPKKIAEEVKSKVEAILAAALHNVSMDAETAGWLAKMR